MTMQLSADVRHIFGKRLNASRVAGLVPAELYGFEVKNLHLFVLRGRHEEGNRG